MIIQKISEIDRKTIKLCPQQNARIVTEGKTQKLHYMERSFLLSSADAFIWDCIQQRKTLAEIDQEVLETFEISGKVEDSVDIVVRKLYQLQTITFKMKNEELVIQNWISGGIRSVHFSLTSHCNFDCIHCFVIEEETEELSTREIFDCLEQLAKLGTEQVNFSGGEIFTHKDIFLILAKATNLGLTASMNTNGSLITTGYAKQLANIGIESIAISIYGVTEKTHDIITKRPGSLQMTLKAIDLLLSYNIRVIIKTMAITKNFHELGAIQNWAKEKGLDILFDTYLLPRQDGSKKPLDFTLSNDQLRSLVKTGLLKPQPFKERLTTKPICTAGIDRLSIGSYGDIYPCVAFPIVIGNIRSSSIQNVLNKSTFFPEFRKKGIEDIDLCSVCSSTEQCAICPGIGYVENSNYLLTPRLACKISCISRGEDIKHLAT